MLFTEHRLVEQLLSRFLSRQYVVRCDFFLNQVSRLCNVIDQCTETMLKSAPGRREEDFPSCEVALSYWTIILPILTEDSRTCFTNELVDSSMKLDYVLVQKDKKLLNGVIALQSLSKC